MIEPETGFSNALLVEDEPNLAISVEIALRKLGIAARVVTTLADAGAALELDHPELMLLDLTLPDGDGIDFCKQARAQGYDGTILMLTARGQVEDRVSGLDSGADDYLAKPFAWEELAARIRALGRRRTSKHSTASKHLVSNTAPIWTCDLSRLRVRGPADWIELTPLEFKLALHLIKAAGSIITREELLKDVWGFRFLPKTRTVDYFVGRLRKQFEANPEQPVHFLTVRGAGYRFQA